MRAEGLGELLVRLPKAVETAGLEPGAAAVVGWRGNQALALSENPDFKNQGGFHGSA